MIPFTTRVAYAFRCFFSLLFQGTVPEDIARALLNPAAATPAPARPVVAPKPAELPPDRAIQMLALLQRDGRFIDFVNEDVSPYPDSQLGAAVRSIHTACRQVLDRYLKLEPIINSQEDQPVTVQAGFDPAEVKLMGNVAGAPPLRGMLRHRGWRVAEANLPSLPQGKGRNVVAPAEVEVA